MAMARVWEEEQGVKVEFTDFIKNLWKEIGYSQTNVEMSDGLYDQCDRGDAFLVQQDGGRFTPLKAPSTDPDKYAGDSIKTFP